MSETNEEKEIVETLPEIDMNLEIIMHDVDAIIPYENNPRDNDNSVDAVIESIKNFGFLVPIVIDKDNVLVAGHTRIKALKKMGIKQVPCILADKLTEEQIKAYRLADNMTSMNSKWNGKLVRLEMKALPEFDFTKFGMPEKFMDFKDRIKVEEDDFNEGQFIVDEPHSKQGDLYLLGNHRLLVGDSTDAEQVKRLVENEEVDLVVTDPPYNVNYEGSDGQTIKNDFMDKEAYKAFLDKVFINLKASLKEGGAFYIWFATMELRNIINSLFDTGLEFRSMLIWKKPSPNLSYADYKWIYEPCMYGWKDGSHNFYGGLTCTNFLEFDKPRKNDLHPTMKPLDLFGYLIQNSSKEHQRVLDLFGGSGTTIICCEDLNRKGLAMEFDEKYADVIVKRYLRHKGSYENCFLVRDGQQIPLNEIEDFLIL